MPGYENVHRGQSTASRPTTAAFEESYDTIAAWLNAPSRRIIATYRNTTEAINAVMYSLLTEFRDGDNVVTTMMEHNSNFVPWYALCHEILPRFGRHVECRVARFDHATGQLDLDHLAELVDDAHQARLLHRRVELPRDQAAPGRRSARSPTRAGTASPAASAGSLLLVDAAQLVPTQRRRRPGPRRRLPRVLLPQDARAVRRRRPVRARSTCWQQSLPFLYGGDMIAEGQVAPDHVEYNELPWKYAAGTPNILGVIVVRAGPAAAARPGADADAAVLPARRAHPAARSSSQAMDAIGRTHPDADRRARSTGCATVPGLTVYGPPDAARPLAAGRLQRRRRTPIDLADALNADGRRVTRRLPLRDARAP